MRFLSALAAALLLFGLPAAADEVTPREKLNRAIDLVSAPPFDRDSALTLFESVAELPDQPADIRTDALVGAARIHLHFDRLERARDYLNRIVADDALRDEARSWATNQLAAIKPTAETNATSASTSAADFEAYLAREQARRRDEAQGFIARARIELQAERFEKARKLCLEALSKDPENPDAKKLLEEISNRRPERGELLRQMIHFIQTTQLEDYQRLRARVDDLHVRGRRAADKKEFAEADALLREAIREIDDSDFLTAGGALDIESLATVRTEIRTLLLVVHEQGRAAGLKFAPEPPLPDVDRRGGLQNDFYALLARIFHPDETAKEPMRFYDFAAAPRRKATVGRLVSPTFKDLQAQHRSSTLTRARWAERWIRNHIGARWTDPAQPRVGRTRSGARILTRIGSFICAQHREVEHSRIRQLREGFDDRSPPLRLDLHLYAAGPGAAVRVAETLRAAMAAGDTGTSVIVRNRLIEQCVRVLEGTQNLVSLGGAEVLLDEGQSSLTLELTRLTEEHPLYASLAPPALTVPADAARYGLWLDLYAEDMPQRATKAALSVRARVLQPGEPLHSHVVPRPGRGNPRWTRLPLMTEQTRQADVELPHFGTFALFGLANPFPETRADNGELIVLIGVRPRDAPTPEPPLNNPNPRIVPAADTVKDYALGPLATEVEDYIVAEDWPELHAVDEGLTADERRRSRDHFLSLLLGSLANVNNAGSPDVQPIIVHEGLATANLTREEHVRLQKAVQRLRSCESHHYVVRVESAVMPLSRWREWKLMEGVRGNARGSLVASGSGRAAMERELAALRDANGTLFDVAPVPKLARSTQMVRHTNTSARDITKDYRVRLLSNGKQEYTAVPGTAEEGLVVEVRPRIEQMEGATRRVSVRVRAARLRTVELRAYPRANQPAARYEVPLWHETKRGAFAEASEAELLDDRTALYIPLEMPGSPDDVIVVGVAVARAQ